MTPIMENQMEIVKCNGKRGYREVYRDKGDKKDNTNLESVLGCGNDHILPFQSNGSVQ